MSEKNKTRQKLSPKNISFESIFTTNEQDGKKSLFDEEILFYNDKDLLKNSNFIDLICNDGKVSIPESSLIYFSDSENKTIKKDKLVFNEDIQMKDIESFLILSQCMRKSKDIPSYLFSSLNFRILKLSIQFNSFDLADFVIINHSIPSINKNNSLNYLEYSYNIINSKKNFNQEALERVYMLSLNNVAENFEFILAKSENSVFKLKNELINIIIEKVLEKNFFEYRKNKDNLIEFIINSVMSKSTDEFNDLFCFLAKGEKSSVKILPQLKKKIIINRGELSTINFESEESLNKFIRLNIQTYYSVSNDSLNISFNSNFIPNVNCSNLNIISTITFNNQSYNSSNYLNKISQEIDLINIDKFSDLYLKNNNIDHLEIEISFSINYTISTLLNYISINFYRYYQNQSICKINKNELEVILCNRLLIKENDDQVLTFLINWLTNEDNIHVDISNTLKLLDWDTFSIDKVLEFIVKFNKIIVESHLELFFQKILEEKIANEKLSTLQSLIYKENKDFDSSFHKGPPISNKSNENSFIRFIINCFQNLSKRLNYTYHLENTLMLNKLKTNSSEKLFSRLLVDSNISFEIEKIIPISFTSIPKDTQKIDNNREVNLRIAGKFHPLKNKSSKEVFKVHDSNSSLIINNKNISDKKTKSDESKSYYSENAPKVNFKRPSSFQLRYKKYERTMEKTRNSIVTIEKKAENQKYSISSKNIYIRINNKTDVEKENPIKKEKVSREKSSNEKISFTPPNKVIKLENKIKPNIKVSIKQYK